MRGQLLTAQGGVGRATDDFILRVLVVAGCFIKNNSHGNNRKVPIMSSDLSLQWCLCIWALASNGSAHSGHHSIPTWNGFRADDNSADLEANQPQKVSQLFEIMEPYLPRSPRGDMLSQTWLVYGTFGLLNADGQFHQLEARHKGAE
ncbi:hypothetical protein PROFUN_10390 [Planoprotostelium fungivorum]|uniref:Uncharacterized protein n=1 Tax=Planoprotostelium fungivorum TaxID=1890364 RepID=A0A2P6NED6_9EUKA|nr:hypothetical protein PROFUN_10390 [Planoprotostelium fungivorum]